MSLSVRRSTSGAGLGTVLVAASLLQVSPAVAQAEPFDQGLVWLVEASYALRPGASDPHYATFEFGAAWQYDPQAAIGGIVRRAIPLDPRERSNSELPWALEARFRRPLSSSVDLDLGGGPLFGANGTGFSYHTGILIDDRFQMFVHGERDYEWLWVLGGGVGGRIGIYGTGVAIVLISFFRFSISESVQTPGAALS